MRKTSLNRKFARNKKKIHDHFNKVMAKYQTLKVKGVYPVSDRIILRPDFIDEVNKLDRAWKKFATNFKGNDVADLPNPHAIEDQLLTDMVEAEIRVYGMYLKRLLENDYKIIVSEEVAKKMYHEKITAKERAREYFNIIKPNQFYELKIPLLK